MRGPEAVVVGSGPNGLAAAIVLAEAGVSVRVYERAERIGGGTRTEALTLPGFHHDVCSAIHPLGVASPFFRRLPLEAHGLRWCFPPIEVAHPLDDGHAVLLHRSVEATGATFRSPADAEGYAARIGPLVGGWGELLGDLLAPLGVPSHPLRLARFGLSAMRSAEGFVEDFTGAEARALFAGIAGHAVLPLEMSPTAAFGLVLGVSGHASGWPLPEGGSQRIAEALAAHLRSLGGEIVTGVEVEGPELLEGARVALLDVSPKTLVKIAGARLPASYLARLARFRYGPGVFKVDWALGGPIPWRAEGCRRAGTVHVGGTFEEIALALRDPWEGRHAERPFVLVGQQSLFDPTRAPAGQHTGWAYCHVPNGSTVDMTARIEAQIERFAPGFRELILARSTRDTAALERHNPNYVGGDINGGAAILSQLFTRPVARLVPYSTPDPGLFLCSASTPPGGGVHGMCGYYAAQAALHSLQRSAG